LALVFLAAAAPAQAVFPGQNGKIAFSGWEGEYSGIFVVNPNGTGLTRLTTNLSRVESPDEDNPGWYIGRDIDPAWSPDGQRIAFSRETAGWAHDCRGGFESESNFDLYVMNADGTDLTQLTSDPPSGVGLAFETDPTWSPDGEWLAYQASGYGVDDLECRYATDPRIVRTPADGPGTRQLIRWDGGHPSWRSDDERIAFAYGGINDMPVDGSSQRKLADGPSVGEPSNSADGSSIVFRRDIAADPALTVRPAD
jgi:Tol biopolymer transport system component